jgi:RNA polymerase sigma-70 factor (ECF subfamily)
MGPFAPASPDADFFRRIRNGEKSVFSELVHRYHAPLVSFLRYLQVPSGCIDDVVQETFLRVYRHIDKFDPARSFASWLMTIGRHVYVDEKRRGWETREVAVESMDDPDPRGFEEAMLGQMAVDEFLSGLAETDRFLIEMRVFERVSFEELARLMEQSEGALRVRFHRLMKRLKEKAGNREG